MGLTKKQQEAKKAAATAAAAATKAAETVTEIGSKPPVETTPEAPKPTATPGAAAPARKRWVARAKFDHRTTVTLADKRKIPIVFNNHTAQIDENLAKAHDTTPEAIVAGLMKLRSYSRDLMITQGPGVDPNNPIVAQWENAALKAIAKKSKRTVQQGMRSTSRG